MIRLLRNIGVLGAVLAAFVMLIAPSTPTASGAEESDTPEAVIAPKWQRSVPSSTCPSGDLNCHRGSPTLADVDNDGRDDIVIATHAGHIIALKDNGTSTGQVLWDVDIAGYIGMAPGTAVISSSPAVADIDRNDGGRVEIAVGFGYELCCDTRGGVIVLEHNGAVKAGWPKLTVGTWPNGVPMPIISSPALGDLDQDGDLEVVYGGVDGRIYARDHSGALLPGFTPSSHLLQRFPFWDDLVGKLGDDTWSSPALGDVDGDGYLDIVIGTSEGNFDDRWGGDSGGWTCPYPLPAGWAAGYCGGSLYVFNRFGQVLPGFPRYILETIQSSPALADVDNDGRVEIFVGTGSFYHLHSATNPTYGFRAYAFDDNGAPLPGWAGGRPTNGVTQASPSIGDIAGDGAPEIVFGSRDGRIHAFYINGQVVSGFPMLARSRVGVISDFDVGKTFVLADYDGDGKMEIFANVGESVVIVDGNGQQLTSSVNGTDGKPAFGSGGWLFNSPAVGNIDGDSGLELIAFDRFSSSGIWPARQATAWPGASSSATPPVKAGRPCRRSCLKRRKRSV